MPKKMDPIAVAEEFARQMQDAYAQDLQAILLVGSAARSDFFPGRSDVNTLVILSPQGMAALEKAHPILKSWHRHNLAIPHFMTAESLRRSLDSYPLEMLDFKTFHRMVMGRDVLADLTIPHQPLRLQIEREARGKLMLLQQALAAHAGEEKNLAEVLKRSLPAFTVMFQGILELQKLPIPADRVRLFDDAAAAVGFSASVFQKIADLRAGKSAKPTSAAVRALFKDLLKEAGIIVNWIDSYKTM